LSFRIFPKAPSLPASPSILDLTPFASRNGALDWQQASTDRKARKCINRLDLRKGKQFTTCNLPKTYDYFSYSVKHRVVSGDLLHHLPAIEYIDLDNYIRSILGCIAPEDFRRPLYM